MCSAAPRGCGPGPNSPSRSTCSSSTRPARCRSPTSWPCRARRPASCCSAIPNSSSSRRRGVTPTASTRPPFEHVLGPHKTMPAAQGMFLPVTWRLAPDVCRFTSEVFYEGKLHPRAELSAQRLVGNGRFEGAGLWVEPVAHDGCRNASDEEVEVVDRSCGDSSRPAHSGSTRLASRISSVARTSRSSRPTTRRCRRLTDRLGSGIAVGTVDKFQGQEAPVVIYSMATSAPEDAPRGMEFLYSLNRLNVATSRARCAFILVAKSASVRAGVPHPAPDAIGQRALPLW